MKINSTDLSETQYRAIEAFRSAKANEKYWEEVKAGEIKKYGHSLNMDVADRWRVVAKERRERARALIPSFDARVEGDDSP